VRAGEPGSRGFGRSPGLGPLGGGRPPGRLWRRQTARNGRAADGGAGVARADEPGSRAPGPVLDGGPVLGGGPGPRQPDRAEGGWESQAGEAGEAWEAGEAREAWEAREAREAWEAWEAAHYPRPDRRRPATRGGWREAQELLTRGAGVAGARKSGRRGLGRSGEAARV
jgi:hypothetical protein